MISPKKCEGKVRGRKVFGKIWTTAEVFTSVCLFICVFGWGLFHGMFGPSMLEFEQRTGVTTGQVTQMITAMTAGGIVGVSVGGWSLDHVDERLFMSFIFGGFGILTIALPWSTTYATLLGISVALGVFLGGADAGMNVTTLLTWGWAGSVLMQGFHFTFAIGTVISPWISQPFLSPQIHHQSNHSSNSNDLLHVDDNFKNLYKDNDSKAEDTTAIIPNVPQGTRIMIPWLIIGIFFELIACTFLVCYFYYRNTDGKLKTRRRQGTSSEQRSHVTVQQVGRGYTACMWILMFFLFATLVSLETIFASMLVVFSVKGLNWTKVQGLALTTVFRGFFAASRGANILVALVLNPSWMMFFDMVLVGVAFLVLAVAVRFHPAVLWVCTGVAGVGMASFYGAAMSWAGHYIPVSGKAGAVFLCGTWFGCLAIPALTGYLFDNMGPFSFIFVCFGDSCALALVYILSQAAANKWGPHYSNKSHVKVDADSKEMTQQPLKSLS